MQKKAYSIPTLTNLGTLVGITQTNGTSSRADGGPHDHRYK